MHIGKVTRSGRTVTVEMPEGFELTASAVEVHRDGDVILLRPLGGDAPAQSDPHWLDQFEREPDAELLAALDSLDEALEDMRVADRAMEALRST